MKLIDLLKVAVGSDIRITDEKCGEEICLINSSVEHKDSIISDELGSKDVDYFTVDDYADNSITVYVK